MTLQEVKEKLFPAHYKTKGGKVVVITGFAFSGHFLGEEDKKFVWDENMNLLNPNRFYREDFRNADCTELIKSPGMVPGKKKYTYANPDFEIAPKVQEPS